MARDPRMTTTDADRLDADLVALAAAVGHAPIGIYTIRLYTNRLSRREAWNAVAEVRPLNTSIPTEIARGAGYTPDRAIEQLADRARHLVSQGDDLASFAHSRMTAKS